MKAEYKRDMNHNYLILHTEEEIDTASYQVRMLVGNAVPSLVKCHVQALDGKFMVYYDITSRQALSSLYENRKFRMEDLRLVFGGFVQVMEEMSEYLLNPGQLVIQPEYLFLDVEKGEVFFCYLPGFDKDVREQFQALTEYVLPKLDHEDKGAVILGYGVYRRALEDTFHLEHIKEELYQLREGAQEKEGAFSGTEPQEIGGGDGTLPDFPGERSTEGDFFQQEEDPWGIKKTEKKQAKKMFRREKSGSGKTGRGKNGGDGTGREEIRGDRSGKEETRGDRSGREEIRGDRSGREEIRGDRAGREKIRGDRDGRDGAGRDGAGRDETGKGETGRKQTGGALQNWKKVAACAGLAVLLLGILCARAFGYLPGLGMEKLLGGVLVLMAAAMLGYQIWSRIGRKAAGKKGQQELHRESRAETGREAVPGYEDKPCQWTPAVQSAVQQEKKTQGIWDSEDIFPEKKPKEGSQGKHYERVEPEKTIPDSYGETVVLSSNPVSGPASLVSREPGELATIYLQEDITVVGKLETAADAVIDIPTVSRIHAKIRKREEEYYLSDLNSRNGTSVNGKILKGGEEYLLQDQDEVDFAQARYVFLK